MLAVGDVVIVSADKVLSPSQPAHECWVGLIGEIKEILPLHETYGAKFSVQLDARPFEVTLYEGEITKC